MDLFNDIMPIKAKSNISIFNTHKDSVRNLFNPSFLFLLLSALFLNALLPACTTYEEDDFGVLSKKNGKSEDDSPICEPAEEGSNTYLCQINYNQVKSFIQKSGQPLEIDIGWCSTFKKLYNANKNRNKEYDYYLYVVDFPATHIKSDNTNQLIEYDDQNYIIDGGKSKELSQISSDAIPIAYLLDNHKPFLEKANSCDFYTKDEELLTRLLEQSAGVNLSLPLFSGKISKGFVGYKEIDFKIIRDDSNLNQTLKLNTFALSQNEISNLELTYAINGNIDFEVQISLKKEFLGKLIIPFYSQMLSVKNLVSKKAVSSAVGKVLEKVGARSLAEFGTPTFFMGPIPVWVRFSMGMGLGYNSTLTTDHTVTIGEKISLNNLGFTITKTNQGWNAKNNDVSIIKKGTFTFDKGTSGYYKRRAYLYGKLSFFICGLVGPVITVKPIYIQTTNENPSPSFGSEVTVGLDNSFKGRFIVPSAFSWYLNQELSLFDIQY